MPLRQLHPVDPQSPASQQAKIDIIAVHGLNPRSKKDDHHAWDTWRTPPGPDGRLWLRDDLPPHVPGARIFLYEYNSTAAYGKDQNSFVGKADELLEDVHVAREHLTAGRPLLFLGHSMGGLLIKQALVLAAQNRKFAPIRDATAGLAFFATPHHGGERKRVRLGGVVTKVATTLGFQKGDDILETLKSGSVFSGMMREQWRHQVARYKIVSFWGGHDTVVLMESAHMGLSSEHERLVKLNADHRTVCKFGSSQVDRDNFALVQSNIKFLYRSALGIEGPGPVPVQLTDLASMSLASATGTQPLSSIRAHCYIPLSRNRHWIERRAPLDALKKKFFAEECRVAALVGLGGTGKTQIALRFAYWAKDNLPDRSVFWVPALSPASFDEAYTEIARLLSIETATGTDTKATVKRHFDAGTVGPWLLIVDNADDRDILFGTPDGTEGISRYLPDSAVDGMILYTTRSREVATAVPQSDVVKLQELNAAEAADLLTALLPEDLLVDSVTRTELLDELTYLPLAITQAAAYMTTTDMPVSMYLDLFRRTQTGRVELLSRPFHDNTRYHETQHPVSTTWLVSFDGLRKDAANAHAARLLEFVSCVEPKSIPRSILPEAETQEQTEFALRTLCGYAFLSRRDDGKTFDMHSLVHLATQVWVSQNDLVTQTTNTATRHLVRVFPTITYDAPSRFMWREHLPHALRLLQRGASTDCPESYMLQYQVGLCMENDGRPKEAILHLEAADELAARERSHLPGHDSFKLRIRHTLAVSYKSSGQVEKAIDLLEEVVSTKGRICPEDDRDLLISQNQLAGAYLINGRLEDAMHLLQHVVRVQETLSEDDIDRLASQFQLAGAYMKTGRAGEAKQLLTHIATVRAHVAEDHPTQLALQFRLAEAYYLTGEVDRGIDLLEHVAAVQKEVLAEGHPERNAEKLLKFIRKRQERSQAPGGVD